MSILNWFIAKKIVTTYLLISVMAWPAVSDPVKVENAVVCARVKL